MSRIGKKLITIPAKVEVKIDDQTISVNGPKGKLEQTIHPDITVAKNEDGQLVVTRPSDQRQHRALHGLTRALVANMVTGVSEGFRKTLVIEGVGYTADLRGKDLVLKLGYSHEIVVQAPADVTFDLPKERRGVVNVDGIDKQVVGQVAANIRELRPPEPYKGKGIRYSDEIIRRKAGKAGKAKK
jgi:large subunit ribosomal protein L6